MISFDTETTGLDLHHGVKPFFVTICEEDSDPLYWEWNVDPVTREPLVPPQDLKDIKNHLKGKHVVLQNPKFDVSAMRTVDPRFPWNWDRTWDTLLAGHLLASDKPHDLTTMALMWLGIDIEPYEKKLQVACTKARSIARSKFKSWKIAKRDLEGMPSAKETVWKFDTWLPRTVAEALDYPEDHPWRTVLSDYATVDSEVTIALWKVQKEMIKDRGLWDIYLERRKLLEVVYEIEHRGITYYDVRLKEIYNQYQKETDKLGSICIRLASKKGFDLKLPKSGTNKSLAEFTQKYLHIEELEKQHPGFKLVRTDTKAPSLGADGVKNLIQLLESVEPNSLRHKFFLAFKDKKKRDTALTYMRGYKKFALPIKGKKGWKRLYPSLNPTGTGTLRWSSSNPNEQNISKKEGFNLRYCFGPAPGREWWSLDYQNIELRIPAYESGEEVMIEIFEKPDDPPFFGSYHLMNASIVFPDIFWPIANNKGEFKKKYASTEYQRIKNFGFAVSYGAMPESGTADRAAGKEGAQLMVMNRLQKHTGLNRQYIDLANEYGYVQTIPDQEVCPARGYPLYCPRSDWGKISPTIPLNYHVQSTACWVMMRAMIAVHNYLKTLPGGYFIVMQVHDELVLDFPYKPNKGNLPKIRKVKYLMERLGNPIGVPLTCGVEYHPNNWSEGITVPC